MKMYVTTVLVLGCFLLAVKGTGWAGASEKKVEKQKAVSTNTEKKIGKLNIAVPYDGEIDMRIVTHADKIGGKFSTILENQYINELEHKKESDRNFWQ